jgi:hypothetical protein
MQSVGCIFFGKGWVLLRDLLVTFSIRRRRGVARLLMGDCGQLSASKTDILEQ